MRQMGPELKTQARADADRGAPRRPPEQRPGGVGSRTTLAVVRIVAPADSSQGARPPILFPLDASHPRRNPL
jgi:hypothetical protein